MIANTGNIDLVSVTGSIAPLGLASVSPYIYAQQKIGSIVAGSIQGQAPNDSSFVTPAQIIARGILDPTTVSQAVAINSVKVLGSMAQTQIIAGHDQNGLVNTSARINTVDIGAKSDSGDSDVWFANDIIAGFTAGSDGVFGSIDDDFGGLTQGSVHSKIAKVIIRGTIGDDARSHAIEATEVGSLVIDGAKFGLQKGTANDSFLGLFVESLTVVNETPNTEVPR